MNRFSKVFRSARVVLCLAVLVSAFVSRADTLDWKKDHVDASIESWNLNTLLEKIATATGWQVYVEPGTKTSISVKFKNQTADEALRRMLKNVNYARKETNGTSQLFVYRTDAHAATQLVKSKLTTEKKTGRILNELIVQLKKGSKMTIEELAAKLHAKILGRDDDLHLYRLGFEDENAATAARVAMAGTSDVGAVDSNYSYANPAPNQMMETANGGTLTPKVMPDGQRFVGLLDTAVNVDSTYAPYMLPPVDVTGQGGASADSLTHGTAMMETLLEPSAEHPSKIQSYNIYGPGETTTSFELTEGLIKAVKAGANPINISSGGPGESEVLHEAIKQATSQGVVIVAAAGNEPVATPTYPAAYPEVIGVTAGSSSGQYDVYANRGRFIDMMAPGTSYISAGGQTWMVQGTSVSTAFVTGQIVNYMNQYHINPAQAWQRMSASPPAGYIRMR